MALQWARGIGGAQREPGRFSSPGGQRYPRGGVWRRLPLPRHRLRLYFEALEESSLPLGRAIYFHPLPKSATANYTANNGARAARRGEQLRRGSARADFSRGRVPGAPATSGPATETPRASGGMGGRPSADAGPPPFDAAPRGGRSPVGARRRERGRRGEPASRAGARGPRTAGGGWRGVNGPGSAMRPTGGGDLGSPSRRPGSDGPLRSPFSTDRGAEARTRGGRET